MRLRSTTGQPATTEADVLAVPIYREDAEMASDLAELDAASGGAISEAIAWGEYNPLEHASAREHMRTVACRWDGSAGVPGMCVDMRRMGIFQTAVQVVHTAAPGSPSWVDMRPVRIAQAAARVFESLGFPADRC